MFKRVLATALTILMLLSVIPATLVSAAEDLPGLPVQPTYYLDDNNGVRWYYFTPSYIPGLSGSLTASGWYFQIGPSYSNDISVYKTQLPAPTSGFKYVFATDAEHSFCTYSELSGWTETAHAGGTPGSGTVLPGANLSSYVLIDDNGATWKYSMFGGWEYYESLSFIPLKGTWESYLDKYDDYPSTGTVYAENNTVRYYATFNESTKSWILTTNPTGGIGGGSFTIIDSDNSATWMYVAGAWYFTARLSNGSNVSGGIEDYHTAFNAYPTKGTVIGSNGQQLSYCKFNTTTMDWEYSTGTEDMVFDYIKDDNGATWVMSNSTWYYITQNGGLGSVQEYWYSYREYPSTGTAYSASNVPLFTCTFNSQTGSWSQGSSSTPGIGTTSSYYLKDNNNVIWYYETLSGTWYIQTNLGTGRGGAEEYYSIYRTYPMAATLYDSNNISKGYYVFNTNTRNWEPLGDISDSFFPGTQNPTIPSTPGVSDGYVCGTLTDPNQAQKVYDTKNRLWTKSGSIWTCPQSNQYTVQNPARYIDSTNRVWEMRNGRWSLNENADPGDDAISGTVLISPNQLSTLTDTLGYTWTKNGYYWTSTAATYYTAMGVTPKYQANDNSVWVLNSTKTTWTQTSSGSQTPTTPSTPSTPTYSDSVAGYTTYVFDGKSYLVPNHTVEIIPGPTTMPYKPEGYQWITYNNKYTLMNLNTMDIYPIPKLYQLPNGYNYYPTGDANNPWKIVGNGTFAVSTITSIELTDYPWKLEVGKTYQCKAEFESAYDEEGLSTILIWSSSNPEVATVDQTGKVTIVGVGRADIKVRAFLGFVETEIDIYGIEPENKPDQPVTPPDEPVTPPVVTTPVSDIFTDVSANAPYTEFVQYVYDNEIFKGMSETTFGPESTMTRAQFYTVLARMAGYTDAELKAKYPSTKFADSQDKWFTAAVEWAYTEGLDGGVGAMQIADANGQLVWVENCFNPDGAIKREDACAALYNFAIKYHHVYFGQPYNIDFADASAVNWWAQPAVSSFSQLGILSGHIIDSGNNFRPEDPATRSDIATIIARYAMLYMK